MTRFRAKLKFPAANKITDAAEDDRPTSRIRQVIQASIAAGTERLGSKQSSRSRLEQANTLNEKPEHKVDRQQDVNSQTFSNLVRTEID